VAIVICVVAVGFPGSVVWRQVQTAALQRLLGERPAASGRRRAGR
jgi:hypothetical protein